MGTGARAGSAPAHGVLVTPGGMGSLGLSTGVLSGAGLVLQVGLGCQGHLPSVTELLGGVNGGVTRHSGWGGAEEIEERLTTSVSGLAGSPRGLGAGGPRGAGLAGSGSQISARASLLS